MQISGLLCLLTVSWAFAAPALKDKPANQLPYGEWESETPVLTLTVNENGTQSEVPLRLKFNMDGTWEETVGLRVNEPRRFTFDAKAQPPTLDLNKGWGDSTPILLVIYKIEGDRLTTCSSFPGKSRPTEFADQPDGVASVQHFRRVKPKK